jgi:hypothetical protein
MKRTRRDFIETSVAASAVLASVGSPSLNAAPSQRPSGMPTQRAKALMASFGLKYPIFEAPHGRVTNPNLAIAVSKCGRDGCTRPSRQSGRSA